MSVFELKSKNGVAHSAQGVNFMSTSEMAVTLISRWTTVKAMYFNVSSCSLQLNQQPGELKILSMLYCSSFCLMHRPTQGVSLKLSSNQTCPICFCQVDWNSKTPFTEIPLVTPCCKMTWFHNSCLQVTRFFFKPDSFSAISISQD